MLVSPSALLAFSAALVGVLGQNYTTNTSCHTGPTVVDSAVAWGSAGALPPIATDGTLTSHKSAYYSWLYSVQRDGSYNFSLAVPPGSPLPDGGSYWTLCYVFLTLPRNVVERGQSDNGTCRQALDDACVDGLLLAARNASVGLTAPGNCAAIQTSVSNYARSNSTCSRFFGDMPVTTESYLNELIDRKEVCPLVSTDIKPGYTLIDTEHPYEENPPLKGIFPNAGNESTFYEATRNVRAILSMYVHNTQTGIQMINQTQIDGQFSDLNCVRITNWSSTVQEAPKLPDPTPVSAARGIITPQGSVLGSAFVMAAITAFILAVSALW